MANGTSGIFLHYTVESLGKPNEENETSLHRGELGPKVASGDVENGETSWTEGGGGAGGKNRFETSKKHVGEEQDRGTESTESGDVIILEEKGTESWGRETVGVGKNLRRSGSWWV